MLSIHVATEFVVVLERDDGNAFRASDLAAMPLLMSFQQRKRAERLAAAFLVAFKRRRLSV